MRKFQSMPDLKAANAAAGLHFFDADTMRWWNSRIESRLFANQCFVTSEDEIVLDSRTPARIYAVRQARPDATINTLHKHLHSKAEAIALAKAAAEPKEGA